MKRIIAILLFLCASATLVMAQKFSYSVATFNRPDSTLAYTAGDAIAKSGTPALVEFKNCVDYAGGVGKIVSAVWMTDTANATNGTADLYLFSDSTRTDTTGTNQCVITPGTDNAAYVLSDTTRKHFVGKVSFTLALGGTGVATATSSPNLGFYTGRYRSLWGVMVATGAWTAKGHGRQTLILYCELR